MLSRVADQLYWLSRYLERADHTARLLQVTHEFLLDSAGETAGHRIGLLQACLGLAVEEKVEAEIAARDLLRALALDVQHGSSIVSCIAKARENCRQVRDLLSTQMWEQINSLYLDVTAPWVEVRWKNQSHEFHRTIYDGVHLFRGLTDSTIRRGERWAFLQLGRDLERIQNIATLLSVHWDKILDGGDPRDPPKTPLDWIGLLRICLAFEAYCEVRSPNPRPDHVVAMILLDADLPHGIRFSAQRLHQAILAIGGATALQRDEELTRLAGRLSSMLNYTRIDEVLREGLRSFLDRIRRMCSEIDQMLYQTYIAYPIEVALTQA